MTPPTPPQVGKWYRINGDVVRLDACEEHRVEVKRGWEIIIMRRDLFNNRVASGPYDTREEAEIAQALARMDREMDELKREAAKIKSREEAERA